MHFSSTGLPSKYGSWGLIEATGQPLSSSPKARALMAFARRVVQDLVRPGCTDSAALNFDALARVSNGSCVYPAVAISSMGGQLQIRSEDTAVQLVVPPGALTSKVPITVAEASDVDAPVVGPVVRFGPPGTQFAVPVNVCITINQTIVQTFGWAAWRTRADFSTNESLPDADDDDDLSLALETAGSSAVTVAMYHSQNGTEWTPTEASTFDPTRECCVAYCDTSR